MTAKEKVIAVLKKSPKGLCDTCLEKPTGLLRHQHVNNTCLKLQNEGLLVRDESKTIECPGCLRFNIINRLA